MKKKILSLLLVLSVLFSMVPLGSISASAAVNVTTNKYYTIKNVGGNRYLNVYCNSSRNNTNITLWGWDGTSGEDFKFVKNGSGYLLIPRCATSRAVNIYGNTAKNGSNVCTWSTTKHSTQTWIPEYVASKKGYILRSAYNKNLVLTAAGNRNGSNVCVKNYNGSSYQIWACSALNEVKPKPSATPAPAKTTFTKKNYLQTEGKWAWHEYGKVKYQYDQIYYSGCGILSIVNAVYNLNGKFIDPDSLAQWAANENLYNGTGGGGSMVSLITKAAEKYGNQYGFRCVGSGNTITDNALKKHLANGGTAVINVPGHYMAIVDYNSSNGKFFVYDCAPGYNAKGYYNGNGRKTHPNGDWLTAAQLSTGSLDIHWRKKKYGDYSTPTYWLYAKK